MLGKTHVAVGVASSLAVLRPETMPEIIAAVSGGAIGGWFCDIDLKKKDIGKDETPIQGLILTAMVVGVSLLIDYKLGNGICDYVVANWGSLSITCTALFCIGVLYALFFSKHRAFTHSIIGAVFFTLTLSVICRPIAIAFGVGYVSHILIDLPNKTGMMIFSPIQKRFSFSWCDSDGTANRVLMFLATLTSFVMIGWFGFRAFPTESIAQYNTKGSLPWFTTFQWYLLIINIVTFIVLVIDHRIWDRGLMKDDDQNFIHTIEDILGIAGGGLGMLLAFAYLKEKIGKHNANWYAIAISETLCWVVIYFLVCNPFGIEMSGFSRDWEHHFPLILYLAVINLITLFVFFRDRNTSRPKWKLQELLMFILGMMGGAVGGFIVMTFTGKKVNVPHFAIGFPVMMTAHAFIMAYLLLSGVL